jgi:3-hydroxyisobutyrate dehydrogenase-like beta-hydroxyacid dehydrogenase
VANNVVESKVVDNSIVANSIIAEWDAIYFARKIGLCEKKVRIGICESISNINITKGGTLTDL